MGVLPLHSRVGLIGRSLGRRGDEVIGSGDSGQTPSTQSDDCIQRADAFRVDVTVRLRIDTPIEVSTTSAAASPPSCCGDSSEQPSRSARGVWPRVEVVVATPVSRHFLAARSRRHEAGNFENNSHS